MLLRSLFCSWSIFCVSFNSIRILCVATLSVAAAAAAFVRCNIVVLTSLLVCVCEKRDAGFLKEQIVLLQKLLRKLQSIVESFFF